MVGTMTGTSIDGDLDAAVVSIHGHGLEMRAPLVLGRSFPLGTVADDLRRIAAQGAMNAREFASIAHAFGECHAHAVESLCDEAGVKPDLAVLHGQTVFHAPPLSWQLIDPWPVAARLGCAVRYDLRGANIASGGQGAPITPLADFILFADEAMPKTILNLGGFANATLLPPRARGLADRSTRMAAAPRMARQTRRSPPRSPSRSPLPCVRPRTRARSAPATKPRAPWISPPI